MEDDDVDEHEENACSIPSLVVSADILPLKEGFGKKDKGQSKETPDCHSLVIASIRRASFPSI